MDLSCGLSRVMESRDTLNASVNQPVAGEVEHIDLDLGFLADMNKTDVAVQYRSLDLRWLSSVPCQQGLRGCDHAANRVYRKLLDGAGDRRGQNLKLGPLGGLY